MSKEKQNKKIIVENIQEKEKILAVFSKYEYAKQFIENKDLKIEVKNDTFVVIEK